jgi:hypothetical protein
LLGAVVLDAYLTIHMMLERDAALFSEWTG